MYSLGFCTLLVSCAAVTKYYQLWLTSVETYSSPSLRTEMSNESVGWAALPLGAREENFFFASSSSGGLQAFFDLGPHHSCLHFYGHIVFSYFAKSPFASLLQGHLLLDLGPSWTIQNTCLLSKS